MNHPTRVEYDLGYDAYQRRSKLVAERQHGAVTWTIKSEPINQRDDGEIMRSLTTAQLISAGEIATRFAKGPQS